MTAKDILLPYFRRPIPPQRVYQLRVEEEFELIDKFAFVKVFQQVHAILNLARDRNIPHIIRGSAGSSLVCFLMGITEIDPIRHGLELARFMNHGRQDLPDIDIDVPYCRREELYTAIAKTWPSMVARISNHVMYGQKVALRETAKQVFRASIPENPELRSRQQKKGLRILNKKHAKLDKVLTPDQVAKVEAEAKKKIGTLNHYSKHCGGIVIFENEGAVPQELVLEGGGDGLIQQIRLNKDETEDAGYIKIDVLSNRGLAQLVDSQKEPRSLLDYPTRDAKTETLLATGMNLGLTFGESRGMRKLFLGMRPQHVEDIAIVLALIRPAAATQGRKGEFLEQWRTGEEVKNPLHRQIIFDDDAIAIVREALGCDSAEADRWRKRFSKEDPSRRLGLRQALMKKGIDRGTQDRILGELEYLALYSFCKSHALSYAQLVWALAYEKAHNPHQFWVSTLNHCHSEFRKWVHYREARCAGILLTREKGPYRLGQRKGQAALVSIGHPAEQQRLSFVQVSKEEVDLKDMEQLGYWLSENFLPGCGIWPLSQQPLERWFGSKQQMRQMEVRFCGVIAATRVLKRDGLVSLITIGVDNQRYVDLVIPDEDKHEVFGYTFVEGKGTYEKRGFVETVQVESVRGVSLNTMLSRCKG